MSKLIQVRNVPEDVHRTLRARAAREGMSLSELLLRELSLLARRPTYEELVERVRAREVPRVRETSAAAVRAERNGRR